MNAITQIVVAALPPPESALLAEALQAPATKAEHDRLAGEITALSAIEYRAPPGAIQPGKPLRVAAWNAERLKYGPASAALLDQMGADVVLLSEADLGMARSGNRHTVADLAATLGMGYAYGVEFVELGLGDAREQEWHRGERNAIGLHGNAILSRFPLAHLALIRLDDGGRWFGSDAGAQRRLGGRMAVATMLAIGGKDLVLVSLHLESESDELQRAAQMTRLLEALAARYGDVPMVIGGDCNTAAFPTGDGRHTWAERCDAFEPLFGAMAEAGFTWREANDMAVTQRMRPDGRPTPPFRRIDWLFTRGVKASDPRTVAAVDASGSAISDHDALSVEIAV